MADQTVTLRITANADGLVTAVGLAKKETSGLGTAGASAGAQVNAGMSAARKGVQSISEQLGRAKQQLIGFAAGFASIHGVRQLAAIADQAAGIRAQLQLATSSTQEYASAQAEVFAISQRTSTAMSSTAELYARITRSTVEYGIEQARVLAMTETINQTFAVSGTAAAAQANAITQLTRAFAGGVLRAEEFNSVIKNSPRLAQALADGMGVGMGELRAQVNAGTVDVQRMIAALESQAEAIATEFGRMPLTIERAWTQIGNAILKYVGDADAASGASREIAEALSWVADHIGEIIEGAWALGKALAAIYTAKLLSQAALYTAELARQITLQLAAASAARDMGIKTQAGLAASLKSIGLVNAALGSLGAAVAGWQVGTYLRTQFVEVERFGIAMVGGLLKAWESLKFYSKVLWEGIKASAIGALNVVRTAAADMIGALAKVNEATDVFGIKSGVTESLRQMEGQIRPTSSAWAGFAAAVGTAAKQMHTNNAAIDESMMALWESAGAAEAADEASGNLGKTLTGTGAAAEEAATAIENLYTHTARLTDATDDVDAMLRNLAYGLADEATRALMDYEDVQARILELEMAWLDLGPMSEAQIAKLAELRRLAAEGHARNMADLNDETVREAQRAAQESARAWEDFTGGLADAVLDGSKGVKRWWKAMIDDMKRQLVQSGLLNLLKGLFPGAGGPLGAGLKLAGPGAGIGFGSILQLAGGLGGGTGGSLLSGLAGAISSGVSGGLISLGGTLAGGGGMLGGLGMGLMEAGGFINSYGLLGGLGKGLTGGLSTMFGGGGFMAGLGQMIPAIAAAAAIAAAIQKLSGGKLFGTSYGFDSAAQNIDFSGAGVDGNSTVTEVRQRSLFRGRKWRTTSSALDDEVRGPLEDFWNAVLDSNTAIARQFGRDAAIDVPASFRQEFNAKGDVTAEIGTILGKTYAETWEVFAKRVSAENIIANIDGLLGTTVSAPGIGVGGGGGPIRGGGDTVITQGAGLGAVIMDVQQVMGEASAIAERWRGDAEKLLDGAQFLLLAATDIHAGVGLLGEGGSLTQVTALIEDLQRAGETLTDTYTRVSGAAALLDQALALSGVELGKTREEIVRFAVDIADAAGGLERAGALWTQYFDRFYSDSERAAFALTQAQGSAAKEFGDIGLDYTDFTGEGGLKAFREAFEAAMPTLSAEDIVQWLEAAAALGLVIDTTEAYNATLAETTETIEATAEQLADRAKILADIDSAIEDFGLTEWEKQLKGIETQTQSYIDSLVETGMSLEDATAAAEEWGEAAREAAESARQARQDSILADIGSAIEDFGLSEWERQLKGIDTQQQQYIKSLMDTGMTLEEATAATEAWRTAAREAAEAARQAQQDSILADIGSAIEDFGLSEWERQLKGIDTQQQQYIKSLMDTGMTLEEATAAAEEWGEAAREAAEAARQAQQDSILADIGSAIEDFGLSEWERQLKAIETQTQSYIDSLVETGMSLEDATAAAYGWRDAATEAAEAARMASIMQPLQDDLAGMKRTLAEAGLSDFARRQAQIARETQEAAAEAMRAGASAADILRIHLTGAERAMVAAALAAADFAAELGEWEFEDYLAGLSDADAQRARVDRLWERRYQQAIEIFGEGSAEAIRVLALWESAISRVASVAVAAADAATAAANRWVSMGEIFDAITAFADKIDERIGHLKGGDAMAEWLAEISGLPRKAQEAVRKPLSEVVSLIQAEYLDKATDLRNQLMRAMQQQAALPWNAQAEAHALEGRIRVLQAALGSITGTMGNAMTELQSMYLASLQGVRDYLDSMLLDPSITTLTPAEQLAEALSQFNAAVAAGDGAGATSMAQTYLQLLRQYEASGQDYNDGFWMIRDALEGMLDADIGGLLDPGVQAQLDALADLEALLREIAANTAQPPTLPPTRPPTRPPTLPPWYDEQYFPNWPQYAAGGWVNGPTTLLAGERGRELILPNPVSEFFSKVGIPVNVGGNGGDNTAVVAELRRLADKLDSIERAQTQGSQLVASTVAKTGAESDRNNDQSRARNAQAQRRGVTA